MDKSNIASMFEMLDSSNKGSISFVQYKEALKTLCLCTAEEVLKDDGHGVMFEKFRNERRLCLRPAIVINCTPLSALSF
uniref:EF-hand domain-containing protein n=1 Tax=Capra hircus TaxID=9925 RepID=A0A8C2RXT6_CAPHI